MKAYLQLIEEILQEGILQTNRTGVNTLSTFGKSIQHDMSQGFPLLTTKKVAYRLVGIELEFFIKGLQSKKWLQDRNCHIWDPWSAPQHDPTQDDLGPIYGVQWRKFGGATTNFPVDQLTNLLHNLRVDPTSRRLIVSAWNPLELPLMALQPCHVLFHVVCINDILHLSWFQRSCDVMIGLPFNLASYATLLHLLCLETGYSPGKIVGYLSHAHIYENHTEQAKMQLKRTPYRLPTIQTKDFTSLLNWEHTQTTVDSYQSHPKIELPIAV